MIVKMKREMLKTLFPLLKVVTIAKEQPRDIIMQSAEIAMINSMEIRDKRLIVRNYFTNQLERVIVIKLLAGLISIGIVGTKLMARNIIAEDLYSMNCVDVIGY